ncbi:hypothetical protein [Leucobacter luti]|uniref:DUF3156 family protein n=1 Tax=Leucobacter luti TaxID=340320 RepID=A0A4Q7U577_9MICO|nr:hypothetical protein [Leucobacter luti]MBL3700957.1 hypothetical protein [Leucobacter luti]RZT68821.1 hypothetical protein EV139_0550 [Leucobacter luti]
MTNFGSVTTAPARRARVRTHPLAGSGPIVDRARQALRYTAAQFGTVVAHDQTSVTARAADGLEVVLSYEPGNYVFSRVYALTITAQLPAASGVPRGVKLSHRGAPRGGTFVADRGATPRSAALTRLNEAVAPHLGTVDMVRASTSHDGARTLTLSPMGGAYVWVLIPPVFKATAFPAGEPDRLLDLIRAAQRLGSPASHSPSV